MEKIKQKSKTINEEFMEAIQRTVKRPYVSETTTLADHIQDSITRTGRSPMDHFEDANDYTTDPLAYKRYVYGQRPVEDLVSRVGKLTNLMQKLVSYLEITDLEEITDVFKYRINRKKAYEYIAQTINMLADVGTGYTYGPTGVDTFDIVFATFEDTVDTFIGGV